MSRNTRPKIPERRAGVPSYRRRKVNGYIYGIVHLDGRDRYLGEYGTAESIERYNALVGRWLAGGRKLAAEPAGAPLSVNELLLRFLEHVEAKYATRRRVASLMSSFRVACRGVRALYGMESAAAFGPKALATVREAWIQAGLGRKTVNRNVAIIQRVWKWGAAEELVPGSTWHALAALSGLRRGDSTAPEPRKVGPVPDAFVDAIQPHVPRAVWAMVELQRLTGMRSGEVAIMRTRDIDVSGALWIYRPSVHKTEHHGIEREVPIGPAAQAILRPWLRPILDDYLFQPREAEAERRAAQRVARVSKVYTVRPKKRSPRRAPGGCYDSNSYRRAIERGIAKANAAIRAAALAEGREPGAHELIPPFHPHQLRHSFATRIRKEFGLEAARVMLGHQHVGVTEIYAERDRSVAAQVAAKLG